MVAISIMIEGQMGLTWPRWKRLIHAVEDLGFAGMFRSDHFTGGRPPDQDALESIVSLAYLADHTQRVHFGPLVAPVSFRHPALLARQAAALDDLSGGRMILGLGAGWQEREHRLFGFELGDIATRMQRLEEGLEVVTRLLNSDQPVTFEGRFFQLREATLLPRPLRAGGPRILIGGNGMQRTLPLVARYAHVWNGIGLSPDELRERSQLLDTLLVEKGRKPEDVRRTMMTSLFFGRDKNELDRRLNWLPLMPELAGQTLEEAVHMLVTKEHSIAGTPDMIVEQIRAYGRSGVEELMLQWFDFDDIDGLQSFARSVLPSVA